MIFLVFVHPLQSPVALEQPRKSSRLFLGVIKGLLGFLRTNIMSWVLSSAEECGKRYAIVKCFVVAY